ncbi:YbjN domain-containing protein [Altericroceibacterium endophyticum]|uniref:YbjN domain-containing protein n=1 Tax=Altericroceibacterium endophyticum TaxID=1808508 RepID=A0A6I4T710_9SPHN|nr:YbjN domain-containing protein [Altericroceibacterium endophyticum]MXO66448.1 hypothetical protein [Altericroceibacterium endophyticum]
MNFERRIDVEQGEQSAPVDMLAQLFEARGWPCELLSDDELAGEVTGSWTTYQLRCVWRQEDQVLQMLALPDIRFPEEKLHSGYHLLGLINEQVWLGHFDIWSNGSVLLYRHGVMLGEDGMLGLPMAQSLVESAIEECDRFYPAFQFLLWGDKSPQNALEAALVDYAGEA